MERNVSVVVRSTDTERCLKALHAAFLLSQVDPLHSPFPYPAITFPDEVPRCFDRPCLFLRGQKRGWMSLTQAAGVLTCLYCVLHRVGGACRSAHVPLRAGWRFPEVPLRITGPFLRVALRSPAAPWGWSDHCQRRGGARRRRPGRFPRPLERQLHRQRPPLPIGGAAPLVPHPPRNRPPSARGHQQGSTSPSPHHAKGGCRR
jgi:hypothetical protein